MLAAEVKRSTGEDGSRPDKRDQMHTAAINGRIEISARR